MNIDTSIQRERSKDHAWLTQRILRAPREQERSLSTCMCGKEGEVCRKHPRRSPRLTFAVSLFSPKSVAVGGCRLVSAGFWHSQALCWCSSEGGVIRTWKRWKTSGIWNLRTGCEDFTTDLTGEVVFESGCCIQFQFNHIQHRLRWECGMCRQTDTARAEWSSLLPIFLRTRIASFVTRYGAVIPSVEHCICTYASQTSFFTAVSLHRTQTTPVSLYSQF